MIPSPILRYKKREAERANESDREVSSSSPPQLTLTEQSIHFSRQEEPSDSDRTRRKSRRKSSYKEPHLPTDEATNEADPAVRGQLLTEINGLQAKLKGKEVEISELKSQLVDAHTTTQQHGQEIARISKRLHSAYDLKVQAKIAKYRESYRKKKREQTSALRARVEELQEALRVSRRENSELVRAVDEYIMEEGKSQR